MEQFEFVEKMELRDFSHCVQVEWLGLYRRNGNRRLHWSWLILPSFNKQEVSWSLTESHLQAVIVKFASELVVMLWNGLSRSSATLSKHARQVGGLRVNLLLAPRFSSVAFEGMRINYGLNFGTSIVDHVVGGDEVTSFESVLCCAMSWENVMLHATFAINHCIVVVGVLGLLQDHLSGLGGVVVDGGWSGQVESRTLLRDSNSSIFLK